MLLKEVKYRILSVSFIIILISVPFMIHRAMSSDGFREWFFYAQPLDFSRYSYIKLNKYCDEGSIDVHYYNRQLSKVVIEKRRLDEKSRSGLKEFILKMSPGFTMKNRLKNLEVMVDNEEIIDFINNLEYKYKGSLGNGYNEEKKNVIIGNGLSNYTVEGTCLEYEYRDYIARRIFSYPDGDFFSAKNKPSDLENSAEFLKEKREYEEILDEGFPNAQARYLSDYLSILAGFLPMFYCAFMFYKDKRYKTQGFMDVSMEGSYSIVGKRLLSVQLIFAAVFYIAALAATVHFSYVAGKFGYTMEFGAFFKYVTFWVMPTVLIMSALCIFIYILFKRSIISCLISIIIVFLSLWEIKGNYLIIKPVIRFNAIGDCGLFRENTEKILANRGFMVFLSLVFYILSVMIYEAERKGKSVNVSKLMGKLNQSIFMGKRNGDGNSSKSFFTYQLGHVITYSSVLSVIIVLLSAIVFHPGDEQSIKETAEKFFIISSLLIFIPICNMERENDMYGMAAVKSRNYLAVYMGRVVLACIFQVLLIETAVLALVLVSGIKPGTYCLVLCLGPLYLGLLGLIVGEAFRDKMLGIAAMMTSYLGSMVYRGYTVLPCIMGYTFASRNFEKYLLGGLAAEIIVLTGIVGYMRFGRYRA